MGANQARSVQKGLSDEDVNFDHFHILRAIGKGSFGKAPGFLFYCPPDADLIWSTDAAAEANSVGRKLRSNDLSDIYLSKQHLEFHESVSSLRTETVGGNSCICWTTGSCMYICPSAKPDKYHFTSYNPFYTQLPIITYQAVFGSRESSWTNGCTSSTQTPTD
ncbi:UNVERIFIED_CONTAM: hypothetical protein PYX00_004242 [Menopon gallinae]|uniref:Uncharacterized protein n=1 Tax=Menopon gallinae TaxID=328185 RepID=A0AAW2I2W4_9NEOP